MQSAAMRARDLLPPLTDSVRVVGIYVRAQILILLIETILYAVGFAIAGAPWWAVLSLLCALLGVIPRIGSLLGAALVLLICWVAGVDLMHLAIVGVTWVAVQAIEGFWLAPMLFGKRLGLHPIAVFVALLAASFLFGPLGLLLAVPLLAVAMVWIRFFRKRDSRVR